MNLRYYYTFSNCRGVGLKVCFTFLLRVRLESGYIATLIIMDTKLTEFCFTRREYMYIVA
jgi:hypothetical protein